MSTHRGYLQKQVIWLAVLDAICLFAGIVSGVVVRLGPAALDSAISTYLSGWLYLVVAILASNFMTGSYGLELRLSRFNMVINWLFSLCMAILVVSITSYAWLELAVGRGVLGLAVLVYSGLWLTLRLLIYHYLFRKEPFCYRVAILGTGSRAKADLALVQNGDLRPRHIIVAMIQVDQANGIRVQNTAAPELTRKAFHEEVVDAGRVNPPVSIIHCGPAHVAATVRSLACDVLLVAAEREEELAGVYQHLRRLRFEGVSVLSPLNVAEVYAGKVPLTLVDELWLMNASQGHFSAVAMRMKRITDLLLILLTLPVALYFGVMTALLIKLSAPRSPVFYTQERVGRFGRIFRIYKFRTMSVGAEQEQGAVWSPDNDPRITWVGRSLRKYRLDELPQLWNVLKGEMSLVGPRPERPEIVEKLEKVVPFYRERENVLPGLTGWAQVRYPYGATIEDARSKLEFDLFYLQNISITMDLRIILRTLRIVVFGLEREFR